MCAGGVRRAGRRRAGELAAGRPRPAHRRAPGCAARRRARCRRTARTRSRACPRRTRRSARPRARAARTPRRPAPRRRAPGQASTKTLRSPKTSFCGLMRSALLRNCAAQTRRPRAPHRRALDQAPPTEPPKVLEASSCIRHLPACAAVHQRRAAGHLIRRSQSPEPSFWGAACCQKPKHAIYQRHAAGTWSCTTSPDGVIPCLIRQEAGQLQIAEREDGGREQPPTLKLCGSCSDKLTPDFGRKCE